MTEPNEKPNEKLYDGLTKDMWEAVVATNPDKPEYFKVLAEIWAEEYFDALLKKLEADGK